MTGYTYDAGCLIAADRHDPEVWALHKDALLNDILPTVPATVLAQAWRGGPQAQLSRLLQGCDIEEFDRQPARAVGRRAADTGVADVVDLAVVDGALRRGDVVVTSDPDDIRRAAGDNALVVATV